MIIKRLLSLFDPSFDWIQVEVTSACNAACVYCPRTVYSDVWEDRHLPVDAFRKLAPAFGKTGHVHLQGWGEPFLHPQFFEMAAIAKAAGCRVGTTTNGMLLNRDKITRMIESGMDLIAFSLAGTGKKNDFIRKGTNLKKVLETIRALDAEKKARCSAKPEIHMAYMLLRSGMDDLENLPSLLGDMGVSQVVVSTLDFIPSEELENEVILPRNKDEYEEICRRLDALVRAGEEKNIGIHYRVTLADRRMRVCTENVQRAVCVSSDGAVSACVYTNLQVLGASHFRGGKRESYERVVYGNIMEESLPAIWKKKAYADFRKSFSTGRFAFPCRLCPKLLEGENR